MRQIRNSVFLLPLVVGLVGTTGCPSARQTTGGGKVQPFRGQQLELASPKSLNLTTVWEVLVQEWSSQSGATVQFSEFDPAKSAEAELKPSASSGGRLVVFPLNRLCEIEAQFGSLAANADDARDVFKGLRERILSRQHQVIASPISVPVLVCYYRADLLKAAGRKPPETWEDYDELVATLNQWAPGLVAAEPLSPASRTTVFFARTLAYCKHPENYSVWFDVDSGQPVLTSPGFVKAIEVTQQTWRRLPTEATTWTPSDCRRLLLAGKSAIGLAYETGSNDTQENSTQEAAAGSPRAEQITLGICALPGSRSVYNRNSKKWDTPAGKAVHAPGLCGFAGWAAGVQFPPEQGQSQNDIAATNFLASVTSPDTFNRAFATLPKGPCRESQMGQAFTWFGPELSVEESSQYCDVVAQTLRDTQLVFELPLVGADEFRQAASAALEPLIAGKATAEECLTSMQQAFEQIVQQRGREAVRDSHRRGLGLSPALKKLSP